MKITLNEADAKWAELVPMFKKMGFIIHGYADMSLYGYRIDLTATNPDLWEAEVIHKVFNAGQRDGVDNTKANLRNFLGIK